MYIRKNKMSPQIDKMSSINEKMSSITKIL